MILARHAEALFWAGRQLERAEHVTRAVDVTSRNAMHHPQNRALAEWLLLLDALGLSKQFKDAGAPMQSRGVIEFLFAAPENPGSVVSAVHQLRENFRTVRDRVPVELWEEANRLHLSLSGVHAMAPLHVEPFELFSSVRRGCQAMTGVVAEAMPRDEGYAFFVIGRMVERSIMTCRMVRFGVLDEHHVFDASTLLRMVSSLQAYRRSEGYDDDPVSLAAFLLTAEAVPRSVLSCLQQADGRLESLLVQAPGIAPARPVAGRVRSMLEFGDVDGELESDPASYLLQIESELVQLGQVIASHAFYPGHAPLLHAQFVLPGSERS